MHQRTCSFTLVSRTGHLLSGTKHRMLWPLDMKQLKQEKIIFSFLEAESEKRRRNCLHSGELHRPSIYIFAVWRGDSGIRTILSSCPTHFKQIGQQTF